VASAFRFYQIKSPNDDRHGLLDWETASRGAEALYGGEEAKRGGAEAAERSAEADWVGEYLEWQPCWEATTSSIRSASFSAPSVASAFRFYQINSPNGDRHGHWILNAERALASLEKSGAALTGIAGGNVGLEEGCAQSFF